ncbi:MAG: sigma-70 family RNA polymerase sigma factor [Actinobacteria bacterium]|nr:MAG: sigma-70 family RNA polymerase sigma factor [Actinomycetota bacterium]
MTTRAMTTEAVTTSSAAAPAGRPEPGRPAKLLAELFEAHAPLVLGICRGMLRDPDEAEDAAQQTFLSAYANLLGGTKPREPAPWLATIARNECRSRVQRRMREPLPEVVPEAERSDPAFRAAQASDVESLRLALAGLPLQQRRAFLLREFTGLSYNELALALGVTQPAVESLLFRARRQLRGLLRAAGAAAISLPPNLRDLFASGSPEAPTTLAKLGSAPLLAKLAAGTAGAAFVTAGAVAVLPVRHPHAAAGSAPLRTPSAARSHRSGSPLVAQRAARPRPLATAATLDSAHRDLSEQRVARGESPPNESGDRSSGVAGPVAAEPVSDSRSEAADSLSQPNPPDVSSGDESHGSEATTSGGSDSRDGLDQPSD